MAANRHEAQGAAREPDGGTPGRLIAFSNRQMTFRRKRGYNVATKYLETGNGKQ